MRSPRKVLGLIPVESRRRRRALVLGYFLLCVPVFAACFFEAHTPLTRFIALFTLVILLPSLLGGIGVYATAPVRPFADYLYRARERARREGRAPRTPILLDEQDRASRDRAHYLAYSVFNWIIAVLAVPVPSWILHLRPQQRPDAIVLIAASVILLHLSLPQAILLWTEPDLEPEPAEASSPALPSHL